MSATLRCAAVLFDMDGTILDSSDASVDLWCAWAKRVGVDPAPILPIHHGRRPEEALALTYPALATAEQAAWIQAAGERFLDGVRPLPGAVALLDALEAHGAPWAVVTSAARPLALARLRAAGLWREQPLVCATDVTRGKPDPEGFLAGARRVGAAPDRCVAFEDAPAGIQAARAAGMPAVGVLSTHRPDQLATPYSVADLTRVAVAPDPGGGIILTLTRGD